MDGESRGHISDRAGGCANYPNSCLGNPQVFLSFFTVIYPQNQTLFISNLFYDN